MLTPGLHKHISIQVCVNPTMYTHGVGGKREVGREGNREFFPEDSDAHPG